MSPEHYLHQDPEFPELIKIVSAREKIDPALVEKDYWIMHSLYGLKACGIEFQLKGGTSLSKGYGIIHRFSEDIDIRITPPAGLRVGKNHDKKKHQDSRRDFFDAIPSRIVINGITEVKRDHAFDDIPKYRNGGIRLFYQSVNPLPQDLKQGILLEAGFDNVTPNNPISISSWVYDFARDIPGIRFKDNRAHMIPCYDLRYTFVEKLQTISTKYRQQQERQSFPSNFMRHYYDVYNLIIIKEVQDFIGTDEYQNYKLERFRSENLIIEANEAFMLRNENVRNLYHQEYEKTKSLYYRGRPSFESIVKLIREWAPRL